MKKIVFSIIILVLVGGGFFYWWQNQADVRELNKSLPEGVKVVKSLLGKEYKVVNNIDGYEFRVPIEWKGVKEMEYITERTEERFTASSIGGEGREGSGRIFSLDRFKIDNQDVELKNWAENNFDVFGLVGDFSEDLVGDFKIVKTQENVHLGGMWVYFFKKDLAIYAIVCGSEEFIREIIFNGQW